MDVQAAAYKVPEWLVHLKQLSLPEVAILLGLGIAAFMTLCFWAYAKWRWR
jgi:hypothetical protein